MNRARSVAPQRGGVLCGGVSHVLPEAVDGVLLVVAAHDGVAVGLGHDRGGGDRGVAAVARHDRRLRHVEAGNGPGIDEYVIRAYRYKAGG